jgi:hypothetical protein
MQPLPPKPTPPYHVRVKRVTAYSLVANVFFLVVVAASGALAPYVALHSVGGPEFASFVLPPLPRFAAPLVSGLAAEAIATRPRASSTTAIVAAMTAASRTTATTPARRAPLPVRESAAPVAPSQEPTTSPIGGGLEPVGGGETTVSPVTPPADGGGDTPSTPVVVRPASSKGNAYGVHKKASATKPKARASAVKKTTAKTKVTAKKPATVKKAAVKAAAKRAKGSSKRPIR